jgi:hypothetical protein
MLYTGHVHQYVVSNVFQPVAVGKSTGNLSSQERMGDVTIVLVWTDVAGVPSAYTVFFLLVFFLLFF